MLSELNASGVCISKALGGGGGGGGQSVFIEMVNPHFVRRGSCDGLPLLMRYSSYSTVVTGVGLPYRIG
jgi:molybdopterin biosynthesis enzyme MoaB